jgi:hypothetical protein
MPGNVLIEISNFVTKGCLSKPRTAEEAPKICTAVDLTLSSGAHPPSIGGLLRSGRIPPAFVPRVDIFDASKTTRYTTAIAEAAFGISRMRQKF